MIQVSESENDRDSAPPRKKSADKSASQPQHRMKREKPQLPVAVQQAEPRHRTLTANSVRVIDLPAFTQVDARWRQIFIPTLYNTFFHSDAPFKDFFLGTTKFIQIVQGLVRRVYPEVDYTVSRDDPIHLLVRYHY